jgi:hypothetical protein
MDGTAWHSRIPVQSSLSRLGNRWLEPACHQSVQAPPLPTDRSGLQQLHPSGLSFFMWGVEVATFSLLGVVIRIQTSVSLYSLDQCLAMQATLVTSLWRDLRTPGDYGEGVGDRKWLHSSCFGCAASHCGPPCLTFMG